jgi:hypothetical protein
LSAPNEIGRLKDSLHFLANMQHRQAQKPFFSQAELDERLFILRAWQTQRLSQTHADLLASPDFGPSCRFFLSDVYAARDFSQRDHDIEHLYNLMSRFLPEFLLTLVHQAIEMNRLTNALDHALLKVLVEDLGMEEGITPQLYAEAYRICNNYDERAYQIQLIVEVGRKVELGTRIPFVGTTLRLARGPAKRAGWDELQDFLERGYTAFRRMPDAEKFLATLYTREMRILDNIFAHSPDPFTL